LQHFINTFAAGSFWWNPGF